MQVRMLARGLPKLTPPLQRSLRSSIITSVNVPATSRLAKHPDQVKVLLSSAHLLDLRILGGIHRAPTKLNSKAAPKCSYQCSCSRRASAVVTAKQEGFPDVAQLCEKVGKVSALVQGLC